MLSANLRVETDCAAGFDYGAAAGTVFQYSEVANQLRFRPVRPVLPAWHGMPGYERSCRRRVAKAAPGSTPPCDG
ncbi:MAG UNVERIFIED_CONTAM: hypothetical protein LVR18_05935 [Planctomycetaceae bacterium]